MRLEGGSVPHEGNLLVKLKPDSDFGQVCDFRWDLVDANIVCRQLGFKGAVRATTDSQFGVNGANNNFVMDAVQCTGGEDILQECPFYAFPNCDVFNMAGVECVQN